MLIGVATLLKEIFKDPPTIKNYAQKKANKSGYIEFSFSKNGGLK